MPPETGLGPHADAAARYLLEAAAAANRHGRPDRTVSIAITQLVANAPVSTGFTPGQILMGLAESLGALVGAAQPNLVARQLIVAGLTDVVSRTAELIAKEMAADVTPPAWLRTLTHAR